MLHLTCFFLLVLSHLTLNCHRILRTPLDLQNTLRHLIFPSKLKKEMKTEQSFLECMSLNGVEKRASAEVQYPQSAKEKSIPTGLDLGSLQNHPRLPSCLNPWKVSHISSEVFSWTFCVSL